MAAWLPNYSAPSVSLCGDCGLLSPNRNYNGNFKEFNPLSPGCPLQSWDILFFYLLHIITHHYLVAPTWLYKYNI